ncbi:hypothetical protein SK803_43000 [Lentzea sp. BCCO 10_0856]|uniref:Uncharacterized protein n=1 Tax=Lentzea miocenica TaxID=3095431 RepID=A0ABU4TGL3_9PSEU|nr:hypothetical protein [Lentzea sp. BCCO 10_0856]MDX8037002.1 hypothetical protein [Lentzea sp. BCCO 10_0856]
MESEGGRTAERKADLDSVLGDSKAERFDGYVGWHVFKREVVLTVDLGLLAVYVTQFVRYRSLARPSA